MRKPSSTWPSILNLGADVPIHHRDNWTDPDENPSSWPNLYFKVFADDDGNPAGTRTAQPEFQQRTPFAVRWDVAAKRVTLLISNSGSVASDLVRVDYRLRYCTYANHKPQEGFSVDHAAEEGGSSKDDLQTLDFVPANGTIGIEVELEEFAEECENLYIRARVCSLFAPHVPFANWDFATDPAVVDGWHRP